MLKIMFAAALLAAGSITVTAPADAKTAKGKAVRGTATERVAVQRRSASETRTANLSGGPQLQDRTTINYPNGRLNGQALFDDIASRTSGAGE